MSEGHSTANELLFLKGLGTWTEKQRRKTSRYALLQGYARGMRLSHNWYHIDTDMMRSYLDRALREASGQKQDS